MEGMMVRGIAVAVMMAGWPALADTVQTENRYGSWSVVLGTDSMTDRKWYGAGVISDNGAVMQFGCFLPAMLSFRLDVKVYLSGRSYRDVMYRIDTKRAQTVVGSYDDRSVTLLCEKDCKPTDKVRIDDKFASELKSGTKLLLRLKNYKYEDVDIFFPIDGAEQALEALQAGCKKLIRERAKKS